MYESVKDEFDYSGVDDNPFAKMDYYDRYDDWSGSSIPRGIYDSVTDYVPAGSY